MRVPDKAEGASSDAVIVAAGTRLSTVMDDARGTTGRNDGPAVDQGKSPGLLARTALRPVK